MNFNATTLLRGIALLAMLSTSSAAIAAAQTTFFNYQGQLEDSGQPANGAYDLAFELYDDATAGSQVGGTLTSAGHSVSGGLFSIALNFGSTVFDGTQLWLQVYVNNVAMTPRTAIRLAPVAEYALTAAAVNNGSIDTAALAGDSVTRSKLAGTFASGDVGFSVNAGTCALLTFDVAGAQVGDLAVISWSNGVTPPTNIVFGPASVTGAGTVKATACNMGANTYSNASIAVTVQTLR
jgi:hypothetical protein